METSALPREGSVMYDFIHGTDTQKRKRRKQFRFWNKWFVIPLYRINLLPLFGIGRVILLLYHTGRKSGNRYITPVEYRKKDGEFLIFASRGEISDWYRNIKANPQEVHIKIGFRTHKPTISFPESEETTEIMKWYVTSYPRASKMLFGWDKDKDVLSNEIIQDVADFIKIIKFNINAP